MKVISKKLLAINVLASFLTVSCASAPKATEETALKERVCFNSNNVRGFDALTDQYVYVRESANKHYLLTMRGQCRNLKDAFTIAISDTTSRVCSKGFAKIAYQDRFGSRDVETCYIYTVERVDDKEHAQQIVDARTAPPDSGKGGTWTESEVPDN